MKPLECEEDPVKAWEEHEATLKAYEKWLNDQAFEYLKYEGPGTDLTVYLVEKHKWVGGPELFITGYKKDGTAIPVIKNGEWAMKL